MTTREPHGRRPWKTDPEWQRLRARIAAADPPIAQRGPGRWYVLAAAAVVAACGLSFAAYRATRPEVRVIATGIAERRLIRLADSSTLTLGPASNVRYRIGQEREVELNGLAEFSVIHDSKRPFLVRARGAVVSDVGTEFVVRAYDADSSTRVAVSSGAVSVSNAGSPADALILRAGQVADVRNGTATIALRADATSLTQWVRGTLVFDNEPLSQVSSELSRWFDVDILFADTALKHRPVSALYNSSGQIADILDALAATTGFRYTRQGRTVILQPRTR